MKSNEVNFHSFYVSNLLSTKVKELRYVVYHMTQHAESFFFRALVEDISCNNDYLEHLNYYYAPCPAKGQEPPKAVNGRGRAGCLYFLYTFVFVFVFVFTLTEYNWLLEYNLHI